MNFDGLSTSEPGAELPRNRVEKRVFKVITPEEIIKRVGNPQDPIHEQIKGVLGSLCGRKYPDEVEDLYQIVLLKILKGANKFKSQSELSTWAFRIAENTFLDFTRRNKTRSAVFAAVSLDELDRGEKLNLLIGDKSSNESKLINKIFFDSLAVHLTDDESELLKMNNEGLSFSEIGQKLGIPKSTVTTKFGVLLTKIKRLTQIKNAPKGR